MVSYKGKQLGELNSKSIFKYSAPKTSGPELESTMASQSTNLTLPFDYDTDRLKAELINFDEPPGPITKSTKKIYLKRLIKYRRNKEIVNELAQKNKNNLFSKYISYFIISALFYSSISKILLAYFPD